MGFPPIGELKSLADAAVDASRHNINRGCVCRPGPPRLEIRASMIAMMGSVSNGQARSGQKRQGAGDGPGTVMTRPGGLGTGAARGHGAWWSDFALGRWARAHWQVCAPVRPCQPWGPQLAGPLKADSDCRLTPRPPE